MSVAAMRALRISSSAGLPPSRSVRPTLLGPAASARAASVPFVRMPVGRPIETLDPPAKNHQSIGLFIGHVPFAGSSVPLRTPICSPVGSATPVRSSRPMKYVITFVVPAVMPDVSVVLSWLTAVPVSDCVPRRLVLGVHDGGACEP